MKTGVPAITMWGASDKRRLAQGEHDGFSSEREPMHQRMHQPRGSAEMERLWGLLDDAGRADVLTVARCLASKGVQS